MLPLVIRELESVARAAGWTDAELGHQLGFHSRSWLSNLRAGRPLSTLAISRIACGFTEQPRVQELLWHYLKVEFPKTNLGSPSEMRLVGTLPPRAQRLLRDYVEHFPFEHLAGRGLWLESRVPSRLANAARFLLTANERRGIAVLRLLPGAAAPSRHDVLATHLLIVEHFDEASKAIHALVNERLLIRRPIIVTTPTREKRVASPVHRRGLFAVVDRVSLDAAETPQPSPAARPILLPPGAFES